MSKREVYSLEEILQFSQSYKSVNASVSNDRQLMLCTKLGTTLGLQDIEKIEHIVHYSENNYSIKLHLVGGGYGCTKLVFEVEGRKDAIELVDEMTKDPEFLKRAKEAGFEFVVSIKGKTPLKDTEKNSLNDQSTENAKTEKRVSKDGTTQEIKGE